MKIYSKILLLILLLGISSCTEDTIVTAGDSILDYEIPVVPVNQDYVVGAHYTKLNIRPRVEEVPTIGNYNPTVPDASVYKQHVEQAQKAGIDFFIIELRTSHLIAPHEQDVNYLNTILTAPNASDMKFAISYNFGSMGLNNNNRIEGRGLVPTFVEDFKLMIPFFQQSNYMKVDGKYVVYILNSHNLFSDDNAALYQQMRAELSAQGIELYLIGVQQDWTPPLRFDFRFEDGVNAVTHLTYARINVNFYDRFTQFHKFTDIAWQYSKEAFAKINIEYVPTFSPSIDPSINPGGNNQFIFEKDMDWFKANCNIARRASGASKLVILDSFNDWNKDTQIESAVSYGDQYLNILKEQFKVD